MKLTKVIDSTLSSWSGLNWDFLIFKQLRKNLAYFYCSYLFFSNTIEQTQAVKKENWHSIKLNI